MMQQSITTHNYWRRSHSKDYYTKFCLQCESLSLGIPVNAVYNWMCDSKLRLYTNGSTLANPVMNRYLKGGGMVLPKQKYMLDTR